MNSIELTERLWLALTPRATATSWSTNRFVVNDAEPHEPAGFGFPETAFLTQSAGRVKKLPRVYANHLLIPVVLSVTYRPRAALEAESVLTAKLRRAWVLRLIGVGGVPSLAGPPVKGAAVPVTSDARIR